MFFFLFAADPMMHVVMHKAVHDMIPTVFEIAKPIGANDVT